MSETVSSMQQQLEQLLAEAQAAADRARDIAGIEDVRVRYLGKKGLLTEQLKQVGALPPVERPRFGKWVNDAKDRLAAKPMIMYEDDNLIALASEEVSLNRLFPGHALNTAEPPPGTCQTWLRST